uniref:Uncharacterized protein n=1 Tax=Zea mays TaxID=4577 RepID=C0P7V6_MAIZE|nr:unknown [Zea mays]ACR36669.1 unknown [Zea mays]
MMCTPLSVSTTSLISPTFRANAAFSKGFCILPLPNEPRSPPRLAELQSEFSAATSSNSRSPETIWSRSARARSAASSRVVAEMATPSGSRHEALRREPSCLIRM